MFQPRYLKHAKLLHKGVSRFLHYKRDLLAPAKLAEITGLRTELEQAMKARDSGRIDALTDTLNKVCEKALPSAKTSDWAENVEVFFVSIVIALGIRSYIAQPFQIPTGSMQPTLNGITAENRTEDPSPGIIGKALGYLTGTSYLNVVSDHDGYINPRTDSLVEKRLLIFRPTTLVRFEDGHTLKINAPIRQLTDELQFWQNVGANIQRSGAVNPDMRDEVNVRADGSIRVKKGQVLARGLVRNGDYVIVNKFAYHFRQPTRGEVFVFTTKNIRGIERTLDRRMGSQHYIKRLTGVPGDTLDVQSPDLLINGAPAVEKGIRKVIDNAVLPARRGAYAYQGYSPDRAIELPIALSTQGQQEYFAMGDNSYNSSDSRYWGPVPEQNLVGPGWICYWPLTSHWGFIR
jgi:signal peptidase I